MLDGSYLPPDNVSYRTPQEYAMETIMFDGNGVDSAMLRIYGRRLPTPV